jgi:hypothetical protein
MLANLGGLCFALMFIVNWFIQFSLQPIHTARVVEKMYKRLADDKNDVPIDVILDDEKQDEKPGMDTYNLKMNRKRKRLWNELQVREKMSFSLFDIMKASFVKLTGASRHIGTLHRAIKKLRYDFDIVRVVRTIKNTNNAMKALLSDTNQLFLRHAKDNLIQTSSEDERTLLDWNPEENYLDLSPDEDKDKKTIKILLKNAWFMADFNSPLVAERIVRNCFAISSTDIDQSKIAQKTKAKSNCAAVEEIELFDLTKTCSPSPSSPSIKPQNKQRSESQNDASTGFLKNTKQ